MSEYLKKCIIDREWELTRLPRALHVRCLLSRRRQSQGAHPRPAARLPSAKQVLAKGLGGQGVRVVRVRAHKLGCPSVMRTRARGWVEGAP